MCFQNANYSHLSNSSTRNMDFRRFSWSLWTGRTFGGFLLIDRFLLNNSFCAPFTSFVAPNKLLIIVIQILANSSKARIHTTSTFRNDSDPGYDTKNSLNTTTAERFEFRFTYKSYLYAKYEESRLVKYLRTSGTWNMFEPMVRVPPRFPMPWCVSRLQRNCTGLHNTQAPHKPSVPKCLSFLSHWSDI